MVRLAPNPNIRAVDIIILVQQCVEFILTSYMRKIGKEENFQVTYKKMKEVFKILR